MVAVKHERVSRVSAGSILVRKRFQFAGALVIGALLPWAARGPLLPGTLVEAATMNTLIANAIAIIIAGITFGVGVLFVKETKDVDIYAND